MKKIIGLIIAYIFYYIGDAFCRISCLKHKGNYIFDKKPLFSIGMWLAGNYQRWMDYSGKIQDWSGNARPWKKVYE